MRVALLSDMHGNAVAFGAALADVARHDVDLIISLGDVAQGGPQPEECADLLRELGCPCVFGKLRRRSPHARLRSGAADLPHFDRWSAMWQH